ncbi:MAG: mechanosensitive ion channel family protein [Clostridia bacterium]|nr:mechanosensitive ion channel family protein [Clostridia bacterium]
MEDTNKKQKSMKHRIIKIIIAAAIMVTTGVAAMLLGAFGNANQILGRLQTDGYTILKLTVMVAFLIAILEVIRLILESVSKSPKLKNRTRTIITVILSLLKYAIVIAGICWGLAIAGVNTGTIFAGVGIVALIVGFGAESLVSDLVTGAFILFEDQYNVGDIVELDGFRGTVDSIGIRTTGIRDAGGNLKIVNNSDIKNIVNRSEHGSVAISTVGISYKLSLEEVEKKIPAILEKIKARNADVFIGEVVYLGVEDLSDSCVLLKFKAEVDEKNIFAGRRLLNREIKVCFDENGIEIAYPQVDVHMKQ